jgi:hypothetical protein
MIVEFVRGIREDRFVRSSDMDKMNRRLKSSDMVNQRAAGGYWEGAPLGNGDIGAVIWGDGSPLTFSLDKADFWELRGDDPSTGPEFNRKNLEKWIEQGNTKDLRRVFEVSRNVMGNPQGSRPYQTKLPVGQAKLFLQGKPLSCRSRLALANGLYTQQITLAGGQKAQVKAFIAREMNVLCLRVSLEGGAKVLGFGSVSSFDTAGCERAGIAPQPVLDADMTRIVRQWGYPPPTYGRDRFGAWWIQRTPAGKSLVTMWRQGRTTVRGNRQTVEFYLDIEYGREEDALDRARANLGLAVSCGFDNWLRANSDFWRDYWSRSAVSVPDARVGQLYDIECYKFACCTGPDRMPIFLKGVWNPSDQFPQYGGDFHTDLQEMVYDHVYAGNRLDFAQGLYRWFAGNLPRYEEFCERFFGIKGGAVAYCPTALDGRCLFDWWQIVFWTGGGPWMTTYFWRHWLCTGDREFLRERVYPLLGKFATTYLGLLVRGRDGRLHLDCTMSPEYPSDDLGHVWIGQDATMDLALARWTLTSLIEAERTLGVKAGLTPRASEALGKLADYDDCNPLTGRHNVLAVGRGQPLTQSHRHHSHLAPIYPLGLLSPFEPAQRELIDGSLDHLVFRGMGVWDGWSYPWASCLYSRGLMPNAALRMLRLYAEEFVAPNTFHTNSTFRPKSGLDNNTWRLMTVEGSFMYLSGVQEMLLQSYGGRIVIFPGIPDDWRGRDIAFDSLQAEGGFLIDARVAGGQFACARIRSPRGGRCVVRDNFPKGWRLLNQQGKPVPNRVRGGWIEWRTRENAVYFIVAARLDLKQAKAILNHWPQQDRPAANLFGVKK